MKYAVEGALINRGEGIAAHGCGLNGEGRYVGFKNCQDDERKTSTYNKGICKSGVN